MDYKTKPLSREKIRRLASYYRQLFEVPLYGEFPVLHALEKLPDIFEGSNYEIVEDELLETNVMAQCSLNDIGGFTIKIKESVYEGAYKNKTGAFLGFINHEICHVFLFTIGFTPIYEMSFKNNSLPACKSVEWQAKALNGEVMIPYEECKNMSKNEIINKYHVSDASADYYIQKVKNGGDVYEIKKKHIDKSSR